MSQFDAAAARHRQLHHPDGHRADPPGRARLGHLLAPAQGPDRLPRTAVDDQVANIIIAQLLFLESEDPDKDIMLYINSPGGMVTAGLAIYDTMQYVRPDVATFCMGQAASMGAFLLAAGAKGKRFSLPHARILIHQPLGGFSGPGDRHRHPRPRDPAHARQAQRAAGQAHRPAHRADQVRHRARLLHERDRGQGVRPHRRGARSRSRAARGK